MDKNKSIYNLLKASYKFAKTMLKNPHSYTLRKNWSVDANFEKAVQFIRDHGDVEHFKGKSYIYLYVNEYKYWTMGAPISETILINRANSLSTHPYDLIANTYDDLYSNQSYVDEEMQLLNLIDFKGRILDIGAGTGMLLGHIGDAYSYVGIEPSAKMVEQFRKKHSNKDVVNCKFEYFYDFGKFDTIVGLFGSPSYVPVKTMIDKCKELLSKEGKAYLVYYKSSYQTKIHKNIGSPQTFHLVGDEGDIVDFGNYQILTLNK